jgi:hypothetical protein
MKGQRNRALIKEILQPDQPSLLVWQQERRHRLPHFGSRCPGITLRKAANQRIDGGLEMGAQTPYLVCESLQPVGQRNFQVAAADEGLFEQIGELRFRHR